MDDGWTVEELEQRWENALIKTRASVIKHHGEYRELKSLVGDIAANPLDIKDYLATAKKLTTLLRRLDSNAAGTIFHYFNDRIAPSSAWDVCWLRLECKDLMAHLEAFEKWRKKRCRLTIVK